MEIVIGKKPNPPKKRALGAPSALSISEQNELRKLRLTHPRIPDQLTTKYFTDDGKFLKGSFLLIPRCSYCNTDMMKYSRYKIIWFTFKLVKIPYLKKVKIGNLCVNQDCKYSLKLIPTEQSDEYGYWVSSPIVSV